jgi:hypothetical protein
MLLATRPEAYYIANWSDCQALFSFLLIIIPDEQGGERLFGGCGLLNGIILPH